MKRDIKQLLTEVGRKTARAEHPQDLDSLSDHLHRHHVNLSSHSLKKLWELVRGKRKLSLAAKNRIALFAGFQSWADLDEALHGDADAEKNYEV